MIQYISTSQKCLCFLVRKFKMWIFSEDNSHRQRLEEDFCGKDCQLLVKINHHGSSPVTNFIYFPRVMMNSRNRDISSASCCTVLLLYLIQMTLSSNEYTPVETFFINCGSSGSETSPLNDQTWTGDENSKLYSPIESQTQNQLPSSVPAKPIDQSSSDSQIPYTTARLSRSSFTYSLPVTNGPKFVRLYFYPTGYPNFDRSKSYFSVSAGSYTLLKDFNASVTADHLGLATFSQEYIVYVQQGQRLNLTFTPSKNAPDAYAFVNGIEIVSMPTDLYYSKADGTDTGIPLVGTSTFIPVVNSKDLQLLYRINVGGSYIGPANDTGLFRKWTDDTGSILTVRPRSLPYATGLQLNYGGYPNYTAPPEVYLTARTYGQNQTTDYNVTWQFEVDSGFTYLYRLHFCEFDEAIQREGERVFQIFINDLMAEQYADVIKWSGGNLKPTHRDYVVLMSSSQRSSKKVNITLKLHPYTDPEISVYRDVILNGIEIFKLSESNNLGGPNPDPPSQSSRPSAEPPTKNNKNNNKNKTMVGVLASTVSVVALICLCSSIGYIMFRQRRRRMVAAGKVNGKDKSSSGESSWHGWGPLSFSTTKSNKTRGSSSLPSEMCRYFSIAEMKAATNNFNDVFVVGIGGFGNVYKGYIEQGTIPVAIKRLKTGSQQGAHEFKTEIEMLSQLRHLHLVSLIGYCNEDQEMILVYDFMSNGTFRDHLYGNDNPTLSWKQRLQICIGAARGLHYLHTGAAHTIIHRDVKTTNILLDEKWVAKVSDFGLSKIGPTGESKAHVSTVVKGSMGYLDPEYYRRQRLTEKSDVYSFGVVLLEALCARAPLLRTVEKKQVSLADWGRHCYQKGNLEDIVDPGLKGQIAAECLKKFSEIAISCLRDDGSERPSMNDVVWGLEFALQLQENAEEGASGDDVTRGHQVKAQMGVKNDDSFNEFTNSSMGQVSDIKSSSLVSTTDTAEPSGGNSDVDGLLLSRNVFSELMQPQGR